MGSFFLKPVSGLSYYSIVKDTNVPEFKSEIPKSFPTGVTLSASINRNNELVITTMTNAQTLPLVLDHDLLLTFSARKVTLKTVSCKIRSYTNSFTLPIDDLPDGIVMMTLSTLEDLPLSERLIYIQRDQDLKVTIEPNKPVYKQRDPVTIRISSFTVSSIPQEAFLSLSAVEKSFTDNTYQYPSTISSWFLLESDIRGPIEEPSYYFDPSNPERLRDLDLLLLTQGWRDFEWKYNNISYYPPEVGITLSGRLRKLSVNKPLVASKVSIGIIENEGSLFTTTPVDSFGRFRLDGIDLTGEATLIVNAISKKGNPQGIVLLDSLKYDPAEISDNLPQQVVLLQDNVTQFKQEYEIKEAIAKKYKLSDTISLGEVTIIAKKPKDFQTIKVENTRKLYGKPDNEVIITSKFLGYQNVFEVLKGRVAGVQVTGGYGAPYNIRIRGINSVSLSSRPLYLIDGVKKSYDDLLSLPVSFIDRIDVLKSAGETAIYGVQGANGVISIITRTGDILLPNQSVNHSVNTKISGYYAASVFYSPQHLPSSASAYEPDLRTTLFWKPDIRLQSNKYQFLKYFNADNSSTIKVTVEGITTTGIPITGKTEYEVR
jgi:TonB-dependent SusC/RagA subfamily outer membrane receptor